MTASIIASSAAERTIFVPETSAFGGGERVLLALSRYLHEHAMAHRFSWYYRTVDLAANASWPIREEHLTPSRQPLRKIQALNTFLRTNTPAEANTFLLIGIQAALHAGLCSARDYSLMILDTPSLLSASNSEGAARLATQVRQQLTRPVIRRAMRRARTVMVTSQYMAKEIRQLYGCASVVVRQGAPEGTFQHRRVRPNEPLRLLSVCRLEASKRVDWIIRAVAELRRSGWSKGSPLDVVLDVVGSGAQRDALVALAQKLGVGNHVVFHGRVSDAGLEKIYGSAHLFLMPARQGYGLPALEALSRGIPVVLHKDSGVSEILQNSPWVEQIGGEHLCEAVRVMAERISTGELREADLPRFPSEDEWAEEVCRQCGWLP